MITIMSHSLIERLSAHAVREQQLTRGEILFRRGDAIRSLFLVAEGCLRLVRSLPHGAQFTLQRAGAGAILAEASLFAETYHCEAVAIEPSLVRLVPRPKVEAALAHDPDLPRCWAQHLAQEVQRTRAVAEILMLKTVNERVEGWLVLNGGTLPLKGRLRQMADEIGVTPEALYRELGRRKSSPM